jgi:hypothetical protein
MSRRRLFRVLLLAVLLLWETRTDGGSSPAREHGHCPCVDAEVEAELYKDDRNLNVSAPSVQLPLVLCVAVPAAQPWQAEVKAAIASIHGAEFAVTVLDGRPPGPRECNVVVALVAEAKSERPLCPGQCRPVPHVDLHYKHLLAPPDAASPSSSGSGGDASLTCTLPASAVRMNSPLAVLRAVFWRRLMECYENKFWRGRYLHVVSTAGGPAFAPPPVPSSSPAAEDLVARRAVFAAVIWIGSQAQHALIAEQAQVLAGQPSTGRDAVVGWAATDEGYPCRNATVKCGYSRGHWYRRYLQTLPQSAVNYMPTGWACAQRRPLRALAHVLTLLDPQVVILLDDDTLLNYRLLVAKVRPCLHT